MKLSIGDLALAAGVPTSTIRYYERVALLRPTGRSEANYRLYGGEAVERLHFIRAAQAAGLTLADIRILLEYREGRGAPCGQVRELIRHRLHSVEEKLRQYAEVRQVLRAYLDVCRESAAEDPCEVLGRLDSGSDAGRGG